MSVPAFLAKKGDWESVAFLKNKAADAGYEKWAKGQLVWLAQDGPVYRPAKVKVAIEKGSDGEGVIMYTEHGRVKEVPVDEAMSCAIMPMGTENLNCVAHFSPSKLVDISEAALFHNLRMRFENGYHYMKLCDNILVFLNSDFETDVLTLSTQSDLGDGALDEEIGPDADPQACRENISTVVTRSFSRLVDSGGRESQSLVVNGFVGSGKRDITRFVLLSAIQLSKPKDVSWWQKLLAGDILLQEFGGSNGYIRWTELQLFFGKSKKAGWFGRGKQRPSNTRGEGKAVPHLIGAVCNAFGLDQSRVTEGSLFPVFLSVASELEMAQEEYTYLNRDLPSKKKRGRKKKVEVKPWAEVCGAMNVLGLSKEEQEQVKMVLKGIIDTGNIEFADVPKGVDDEDEAKQQQAEAEAKMGDNDKQVFGVDLGSLRAALKVKYLYVRSETYEKERSTNEKYAVRDGLARSMYSIMFDWVISMVNAGVSHIDDAIKNALAEDEAAEAEAAAAAGAGGAGGAGKRVSKGMFRRSKNQGAARGKARSLQRTKPKGNIGIVGVLETASLNVKKSALEDLYQNYRLERFHNFFSEDLVRRNTDLVLGSAKVEHELTYPENNDLVLDLFMGSAQANISRRMMQDAVRRPSAHGGRNSLVARAKKPQGRRAGSNKPVGNNIVIGRAGGSALGIMHLIEEEINLPGGNDKGLARRITRKGKDNPCLTRSSVADFTIAHFGGRITYTLEGVVDRGRANTIPLQVMQLLAERSSIPLVRKLVAFKAEPIGRSGIMGKRELESLLEGEKKDDDDSSAMISTGGKGDPNAERRGNERAKRVINEMNRAIAVVSRTKVEYLIALAANAKGDGRDPLEPDYLLSQIRQVGFTDAICHRLYDSLRGAGIPAKAFVNRYGPLHGNLHAFESTKTDAAKIKAAVGLCRAMADGHLLCDQWLLSEDKTRVFVNAKSHFTLETALRLLQSDAAVFVQKLARRFLCKLERIRRMQRKIRRALRHYMENSNRKGLTTQLKRATQWGLKHHIVEVAKKRLEKLVKEAAIVKEIEEACESKNCPTLYRVLRQAEEAGMTANDYPAVSKGIVALRTLEHSQISKVEREELEQNFAAVAMELRMRSDSLELEDDSGSEYTYVTDYSDDETGDDEDDEDDEGETSDGETEEDEA